MRRMIPYREAARLKGVSEESLRRQILLGEIAATPVDDDRQYVLDLDPQKCRCPLRKWTWIATAFLLFLGFFGTWTGTSACGRCASRLDRVAVLGIPAGTHRSPTRLTGWIAEEGGASCDHAWGSVVWAPTLVQVLADIESARSERFND